MLMSTSSCQRIKLYSVHDWMSWNVYHNWPNGEIEILHEKMKEKTRRNDLYGVHVGCDLAFHGKCAVVSAYLDAYMQLRMHDSTYLNSLVERVGSRHLFAPPIAVVSQKRRKRQQRKLHKFAPANVCSFFGCDIWLADNDECSCSVYLSLDAIRLTKW